MFTPLSGVNGKFDRYVFKTEPGPWREGSFWDRIYTRLYTVPVPLPLKENLSVTPRHQFVHLNDLVDPNLGLW